MQINANELSFHSVNKFQYFYAINKSWVDSVSQSKLISLRIIATTYLSSRKFRKNSFHEFSRDI